MITIDPTQAIALERHYAQTICCVERQLWLSQEGLIDDIVLSSGECITLRGRGLIVIQSLCGRALFRVKHPASWFATLRDRASEAITRLFRARHNA